MQKKLIIALAIIIGIGVGGYYLYSSAQSASQKSESPSPISKEIPTPGTTTPVLEYGSLYKTKKNTDQKLQEAMCENFSQEQCENNDSCQADYRVENCNDVTGCTNYFDSCRPSGFNSNEIQQIKTECEKINGEYKKGAITGPYCVCNLNGRTRCFEDLISQLRSN